MTYSRIHQNTACAIASALLISMISAWTWPAKAADDQGALNFTGSVARTTCELDMPPAMAVNPVKPSELFSAGHGGLIHTGQTLTLRLHGGGCTDGVLPVVTGDPSQWPELVFYSSGLLNRGSARNVAFALAKSDGSVIRSIDSLNGAGKVFPAISRGTSTATFEMVYLMNNFYGYPVNQLSLSGSVISSLTLNITYP